MDRLYIPVIILHLSIVAKNILLQLSHNYGVWNYWQQKLLYCIFYIIWIDWHMIFGLDRRVGVWSLPWRWLILSIPLTTGRGTGAETCGLDDVFPPDDLCSRPDALCLYIYIYIYIYIYYIYALLHILIPGCLFVTFGICFKQHFDTRYLVFYNPSPPRMFLSLDLLSECRIQHGAIGSLYVTSSYSTWIFCRGVSGFATDCRCDFGVVD